MADTSTFMPIGELPMIDYGAVYRNAKARRELEEEKKLAYLNQFQQERGAFTPGLQDQLQMEWDAIEQDLDEGDMSFEAKARRQKLYNTYKQHAADALTYAETINGLEASILADPTQYNDPAAIMQQLEQARTIPIDMNMIGNATSQLPRLGEFRRYALPEIAPNAAAGMILQNLKASGGFQNFYDMAGKGALDPEAVANSVSAWFGTNSLSQEEEDQAIAYVLHQLGGLSGNMEDLSKIKNLDDAQREEYIGMYAQYVTKSLTNMLATDIETEKEKEQREYALYRRKLNAQAAIQRKAAEEEAAANAFALSQGDISYAPAITETGKRGNFIKTGEPDLTNAGFVMHSKIEGSQPFFRDERGNQRYITSIGINQKGEPYAVIRSNQSVKEGTTSSTHLAHEVVPMNEIPLNGLSNASQAAKIRNTFQQMLPYAQTLSQNSNQPGVGPPPAGAAGVDQSLFNLSQLQPDKDSPEYRQFVDANNYARELEQDPFAFVRAEPMDLTADNNNPLNRGNIYSNFLSLPKEQQLEQLKLMSIQNSQGALSQWKSMSDDEKVEMMLSNRQHIMDQAANEIGFKSEENKNEYKGRYFGDLISEGAIRRGISENPNPTNIEYNTPTRSHVSFTIEPSQVPMNTAPKGREELYDMTETDMANYAVDLFTSQFPTIGDWHNLSNDEKFQLIKDGEDESAEGLADREGFGTKHGAWDAIQANEDKFTYPVFLDIARMSYYNYGDKSEYKYPIEQPRDSYIKKAIEEQKKRHEEQGLVPPPVTYPGPYGKGSSFNAMPVPLMGF